MSGRWRLNPREPKSYSTKEQEHIYTYITHPSQSKEEVISRQTNMKKDNKQHGNSHEFTAISGYILKLNVLYSHLIGIRFMISRKAHAKQILVTI